MPQNEIKMKMSLATAGVKNGLTKAKASVNDFAVTTKSKFASIKKSFAGFGGILTGAVVGGFTVAAKSALNYAKEVSNLSSIAGIGVEEFQKLAAGAKTVGVENDKLADIFKDVNDKMNDFLQAGSGPMKDFFEYIGPAVGVTADNFKDLSGPQALQLYYDSLEKANLNHEEMTFYMEAIANDATVLIPLLAENGKKWKILADEAERAGLVMGDITVEELKAAQIELDKTGNFFTVLFGKMVVGLKDLGKWWYKGMFGVDPNNRKRYYNEIVKPYEDAVAAVKKIQDERKDNAIKGIKVVTEAEKKANIERAKLAIALGKTEDKIYAEREKRAKKGLDNEQLLLKATKDREAAMTAFLNPLQSAEEKMASLLKLEEATTVEVDARLKVNKDQEKILKSITDHVEERRKEEAKSFENAEAATTKRKKLESELGELVEGTTAHLKKQEAIAIAINEEAEARKVNEQAVFDTLDAIAMKFKDRADARKKAAEDQAEADAAAIDAGIKRLELELELAKAEGDPARIAAAQESLDLENQIVSLIDQHKLSREEAAAIVTKQNAALKDQKDLQLELLKAEADGNILLADELQKRVDKQEEAVAIMEEFKISMAEALSIAEKLAALRAGPDLNQSGFTTGFEQREFNRQQKKQQKLLRAAQKQEERDQREQGGNIPNVSRQKRQTDFGPVNRLIAKDKSERIAENKAIGRLVRQGMKRPAAEAQFAQARAARQAAIDAKRAQQMPFGIQDPRGTTQLTQEQIDAITIAPAEIARRRQVRADAAEQKVRDQQAKNEQQADAILARSAADVDEAKARWDVLEKAQDAALTFGDNAEYKRLKAEESDLIRGAVASRKKAEQEAADLRASGPLGTTKLTPEQIAAITTGGGAKPQPGGKGQPGQPGGGGNVKPGQPGGGGKGKPGQPGKPPAKVKKPAKPVDPAVDELMKNGAKLDKQTAVLEQIKAALDC